MTDKLLACPFCGGDAERRNPDHPHGGMVNCRQCGAEAFGPKWNARAALAATPTHRSHDMTDAKLLTEALGNIGAMGYSDDPAVASGIAKAAVDMARKARADYFAALAAAPQPAPVDREALVEVIQKASADWGCSNNGCRQDAEIIADALLARGLRLPGETRNRVEYDDAGKLDEVVTDAGMHLERMSDEGWYLSGQRSDGSEIAVWFKGTVTLVEERPANE